MQLKHRDRMNPLWKKFIPGYEQDEACKIRKGLSFEKYMYAVKQWRFLAGKDFSAGN